MKIIEISKEIYNRSEIAIAAELDRLTKIRGFGDFENTFREAYRLTHGCRIYYPYPGELNVWKLYFDNEADAIVFLLKWS